MKNGKYRVGFDIGGVISKFPEPMKALMRALASSPEHEVFIITDMPIAIAKQMLECNNVPFDDEHLICVDFSAHQDLCKSNLAETHGIDIMIDDRPDYVALGFQIGFIISPRPLLPYEHASWKKL